ncbi:RNA polymerase sigma factor [Planctomycetota bacterium]
MQDEQLVIRCKNGNKDALRQIYEKYKNDLLILSIALLNNIGCAEDVVHDVFTRFIRDIERFELTGSLRSYLLTCAANCARNINKAKHQQGVEITPAEPVEKDSAEPVNSIVCNEQLHQLINAMTQLPYDQREAIILHFQAGMTFEKIAEQQEISVNTIKSRYRYGIEKLRSILGEKAKK